MSMNAWWRCSQGHIAETADCGEYYERDTGYSEIICGECGRHDLEEGYLCRECREFTPLDEATEVQIRERLCPVCWEDMGD